MSQKHNGKASMGHNMKRDGISSDSNNNLGKTGLAVLRISVVPQPDKVIQYLKSMYLHCLSECGSSNIDGIFTDNGGSGLYPVFTCPDDPDPNDKIGFEKWKYSYAEFNKKNDALKADKQKLYAIMVLQMSQESFTTIQENPVGAKAMLEKCPKQLIDAVRLTHMGDSKVGNYSSLHKSIVLYNGPSNRMGHNSLTSYYSIFLSFIENIRVASNRISTAEFMDDSVPGEQLQALKFIDGLNSNYDPMRENYDQNLKDYPETLKLAYFDASNFKIKVHKQTPIEKEIMVTNRKLVKEKKNNNKDGKSSGNEKNTNIYGGRIGNCNKCGMEGHYLYECKEPVKGEGKQSKGGEANPKAV